MIRSFCAEPGCTTLTCSRRCSAHALARDVREQARRRAKNREHGLNTRRWRRLRAERLAVAQGLCELQLRGCRVTATTGHLDPALAGDHTAATLDDVRAACLPCHGTVDAPRAARGASKSSPLADFLTGGHPAETCARRLPRASHA